MTKQFELYSDGGGDKASSAASAAIVTAGDVRCQLVVYLGGATNNEAEIFGGLAGFAALRTLAPEAVARLGLRWVCDSEYVLKSATAYINTWQKNGWKTASKQPVKNRALWQAFLALSPTFRITPEHVRGHTGHPENEACDRASTWARGNAEQQLDLQGEGPISDGIGAFDEFGWHLLDGRPFLNFFRECDADPSRVEVQDFIERTAAVARLNSVPGISAPVRAMGARPAEKAAAASDKNKNSKEAAATPRRSIIASLEAAYAAAHIAGKAETAWKPVAKQIAELIAEIKKMR